MPVHILLKIFFLVLVFIEFVTILLLFYVLWFFFFFGHKAPGILAPGPGIEPATPELEGEVLTTGPPGKSPHSLLHSPDKMFQKYVLAYGRYLLLSSKLIFTQNLLAIMHSAV